MTISETPPQFIQDPDEDWCAAIAETREEAARIFEAQVGLIVPPEKLKEIRLARAPVPREYEDDYSEWYEVNPAGQIVAWEAR